MMLTILTWILFFSFTIQVGYWLIIFPKIANLSPNSPILTLFPSVSVILCIKNEASHIIGLIQIIIDQNYPDFELIIIDDHSQDQTWAFVTNYALKNPKIRAFKNPKTGKKSGIIYGISQAKHSWLLFTDGDCLPSSNTWILKMVENTSHVKKIVLGHTPYLKTKGWLNKVIRFEAVFNTIQSFSSVLIGMPYSGVGRNLMYHKSIFDPSKMRLDLIFGDDDILVNQQSSYINTSIASHPDSFVYTSSKKSWNAYFNQKRRHFSSSLYYNLKSKLLLGGYFLSFFIFYCTLFILLLYCCFWLAFVLYVIRIMISWTIYSKCCYKWNEKDLIPWYLILELQYVLLLFAHIPFLFISKKSW